MQNVPPSNTYNFPIRYESYTRAEQTVWAPDTNTFRLPTCDQSHKFNSRASVWTASRTLVETIDIPKLEQGGCMYHLYQEPVQPLPAVYYVLRKVWSLQKRDSGASWDTTPFTQKGRVVLQSFACEISTTFRGSLQDEICNRHSSIRWNSSSLRIISYSKHIYVNYIREIIYTTWNLEF